MGMAIASIDQITAGRIESGAFRLLAGIGNPAPPISALALADAFGLQVKRGFVGLPAALATMPSRLLPERALIEVRQDLHDRALHTAIALELGHWALGELGLQIDAESAEYMAAALMLPLVHLVADLGAGASYAEIRMRHAYCDERFILARRIALSSVPWLFSTQAS